MKSWFIVSVLFLALCGFSQAQAGTICVGQTVYGNNGNDLIGQVAAIFGDKVEVKWFSVAGAPYSGDDSFWTLETLSPEVECSSGICKNTSVYGNNGNSLTGVVSRVFENGKTEVRWNSLEGAPYDGNPSVWNASDLSSATYCVNGLCVGNVVYGNNGNDLVGVVSKLYLNGKAGVQWNSLNGSAYSGNLSFWDSASLSAEVPSANGIDAGDIVHGNNGNDLIGTVLRVFANGKVVINWTSINGEAYSGAASTWNASDLQKESFCEHDSCHH